MKAANLAHARIDDLRTESAKRLSALSYIATYMGLV